SFARSPARAHRGQRTGACRWEEGGARHRRRAQRLAPCVLTQHKPVRRSGLSCEDAVVVEATRTPELTIVPGNEARWDDIAAVFGTRGDPPRCWCQRFKMQPGESWRSVGPDELAFR